MDSMLLETMHVWNMWSLNPWHFDLRFPAAKCVLKLEYKQSGKRNSSVDSAVSPSPEFALVDKESRSYEPGRHGHASTTAGTLPG
jgi:hypothetical protein